MTDSQPMWLRLRQIALVAAKLAPVEQELIDVLGIEVCYRDPGVGHFGLENALFPIGNQLLEVVAPVRDDTAGGRYLERRRGDGGYMVITQCNDHAPRRARVEALGDSGENLQRIEDALTAIDDELVEFAEEGLDENDRDALLLDAGASLASYRDRMPDKVYQSALKSAYRRRLRDKAKLPRLSLYDRELFR